jgi:hypothetical protein
VWGSQNGVDWLHFNPVFDTRFRTFVGPIVPEPATPTMLLSAVLGLLAFWDRMARPAVVD